MPKLPFDLPSTTTIAEPHQYVKQLSDYLESAKEFASINIMNSQKKSKERHDLNRQHEHYSIGEFVYMKQLGLIHKLAPKFIGPYQIIQQLNVSTYRIQNPDDLNEILNVHINRLRRFYPMKDINKQE
jgi:hypothetical protein